jgi:UDP-N-acetylmuramate: L-alanyl-gamma-D-glutamyl-meso-diaminopimelate ligase
LTRFNVQRNGKHWGDFSTPLIGDFNVLNCLAVIIAADAWGVDASAVANALASFKSVRRRCEVRGEVNGVIVIDDFAHHPTAVRETLKALRARFGARRLLAVFEPRSWSSRLSVFQNEYPRSFTSADYVVIANVFDVGKVSEKGRMLDTTQLIEDISQQNKPALALNGADEIVAHLLPIIKPGDVIAVMSNGGFDNIHEKLLDALAATRA